jgi:hypothetical protein
MVSIEVESHSMNIFDAPPDDQYIRYCKRLALQGGNPSLPIDPATEPQNVHSIEAARTRRATAQLMRGRNAFRERPL